MEEGKPEWNDRRSQVREGFEIEVEEPGLRYDAYDRFTIEKESVNPLME